MAIISISQPRVYPHITYLDKINKSDIFVISDDLNVKKGLFEIRNKYYCEQPQKPKYLNVPIVEVAPFHTLQIRDVNFAQKHREIIKLNYKRMPFFDEGLLDYLVPDAESDYFIEYFFTHITRLMKVLKIETDLVLATDVNSKNTKNERLSDIINHYGGDLYLSGVFGKKYIDKEIIDIPVTFHDTTNAKFHTNPMTEDMLMVLDTIFYVGVAETIDIIHG